jgi:uncharacterized protein YjbI with pentapeptide repeats
MTRDEVLHAVQQAQPVRQCKLTGMDFSRCDLSATLFERCDFTQARLQGADLTDAQFIGCTFAHADLSGCIASGVLFLNADSSAWPCPTRRCATRPG